MTTTTLLREWWAPACTGPFTKVALYGKGAVTVRSTVVDAVHALNRCLEAHDYRSRAADTGGYNCRRITGGKGYSLHAFGTAIDINWKSNPYGPRLVTDMPPAMVAAIKAIRTSTGRQVWRWGGDYRGNKDAMHFEVVCHPADLAAGIDPATVPGMAAPVDPQSTGDPFMALTDAEQTELLEAIRDVRPTLIRLEGTSYEESVCILVRATFEKIPLHNMDEVRSFKESLDLDRDVWALPKWKYDLYRTRKR